MVTDGKSSQLNAEVKQKHKAGLPLTRGESWHRSKADIFKRIKEQRLFLC